MKKIYNDFDNVYIKDKTHIFNTEFVEMLELKNLLDNAFVTIESANYRKKVEVRTHMMIIKKEMMILG